MTGKRANAPLWSTIEVLHGAAPYKEHTVRPPLEITFYLIKQLFKFGSWWA